VVGSLGWPPHPTLHLPCTAHLPCTYPAPRPPHDLPCTCAPTLHTGLPIVPHGLPCTCPAPDLPWRKQARPHGTAPQPCYATCRTPRPGSPPDLTYPAAGPLPHPPPPAPSQRHGCPIHLPYGSHPAAPPPAAPPSPGSDPPAGESPYLTGKIDSRPPGLPCTRPGR
jgi:hypothetical protein